MVICHVWDADYLWDVRVDRTDQADLAKIRPRYKPAIQRHE